MRDNSARQSAATRAKMRRLRSQYRKRMIVVGVLLFIVGAVAGVLAGRWYDGTKPRDVAVNELAAVTPEPMEAPAEPEAEPEAPAAETEAEAEPEDDFGWDLFEGAVDANDEEIFPESASTEEAPAEAEAQPESADVVFPEVETSAEESAVAAEPAEEAPVEETPAEEAPAEETPAEETPAEEAPAEETPAEEAPAEETPAEENPAPATSSDEVAEYDPTQAEVGEEYLNLQDESGQAEVAAAEGTPAEEAPAEETPAEETPAEEAPVEEAPAGPQVIAIVPYGESFTYPTQVKADGTARVEATDEPFETVNFTQTMKDFMRPTDFANKYSTIYKLQGNEAGAGFELILDDYTGQTTIVPQNVVDITLRSESGDTMERGYQLMDAEMGGNYNVALTTNVPKMLYKRYEYSTDREEMAYLVVTTYNDGVAQQILFQLESDEVEEEPEIVYNTLQRGIKSDEVEVLQKRLVELGYLKGTADGSFGQMTEDAIKAAQEAFGMEANGIADNAFQQKLFEGVERPAPAEAETVTYATLKLDSTGDAVVKLQVRLRELGYYDGKADGGYGYMTETAVKKAQGAYGMDVTGVADDAFQQKLYGAEQP